VHLSSFVLVITHDPPTTPHGHTPSIFLEGKGFSIERAHGHGLKDGGRNGSRTLCGVRAEGDQLDLRGLSVNKRCMLCVLLATVAGRRFDSLMGRAGQCK
jgi:hypothetical protein